MRLYINMKEQHNVHGKNTNNWDRVYVEVILFNISILSHRFFLNWWAK